MLRIFIHFDEMGKFCLSQQIDHFSDKAVAQGISVFVSLQCTEYVGKKGVGTLISSSYSSTTTYMSTLSGRNGIRMEILHCKNISLFLGYLGNTKEKYERILTLDYQLKVERLNCLGPNCGVNSNDRWVSFLGSAYRADRPAIRQAEASVFPSFFSQLKS